PVSGACGYSVRQADTSRSVPAAGGTVSIPVTTTNAVSATNCVWTVVISDAARSFVTLVDPQSGSSSAPTATVNLNVAANTGEHRQPSVRVANVPFTITQAAASCSLALGGDVKSSYAAGGATGRVTITPPQGAGCAWTAARNDSSITAVSPASGTDDGAVT